MQEKRRKNRNQHHQINENKNRRKMIQKVPQQKRNKPYIRKKVEPALKHLSIYLSIYILLIEPLLWVVSQFLPLY